MTTPICLNLYSLETQVPFLSLRGWQELYNATVRWKNIQNLTRSYYWSWICFQDHQHRRETHQATNLGYGNRSFMQAGIEAFRSITRAYYRSAIGALLVYDCTNRDSFINIKGWLDEVKMNSHAFKVLVANKSDLHDK